MIHFVLYNYAQERWEAGLHTTSAKSPAPSNKANNTPGATTSPLGVHNHKRKNLQQPHKHREKEQAIPKQHKKQIIMFLH